MLPGKSYSPEEILAILARRAWMVILPAAIGLTAGWYVARTIPELYKSETLIMVVPKRIPDTYVKATDTSRIEDRLLSIREQIHSRSRLERIIQDFNLYQRERARGVMEDVVAQMRSNIDVLLEGQNQESFRISYVNPDARTAQKVTERLASWYIEENMRDRESLAASTNEFLDAELEDAKRRLVQHEKTLEEYRRRFSGQLPSQLETNLQSMQSAQLQLQSAAESINRARERRLLIERQLADVQSATVAVAAADPAQPGQEAPPQSAAQQLEAAQATLQKYKLRYTPDHPDIRSLERVIRDLEAKAAEEAQRPVAPVVKTLSPAEATRQRRIKDYQAELDTIDRQIAAAQADQARLQASIGDYKGKIDAVPARESELVELMRDYTTLQATYASLLGKREDYKLATNVDRRQIGEQFKVLDAASLPERPINAMKRIQVVAGGLGAGLALGVFLIGFLEYRDVSLKNEDDVNRVLSLPVLALVPLMESERDLSVRKRRKLVGGIVTAVIVLGSAAAVLLWRLQS